MKVAELSRIESTADSSLRLASVFAPMRVAISSLAGMDDFGAAIIRWRAEYAAKPTLATAMRIDVATTVALVSRAPNTR
jgi:hypothetical protein